ncbi:MAG: hypothetical protein ACEQSA_03385 [Weeksellaceae bacterium]
MKTLEQLSQEIDQLKLRNKTVDTNKAWETSWTRKLLIIAFTYITIGLYINMIGVKDPLIHAIVPSLGFLLSTLSLPYFKKLWQKYVYNN